MCLIETYAAAPAKISIFRAFVIKATADEKRIDKTVIAPIRSVLSSTKYRSTTEERGSNEATTVVAVSTIPFRILSSYLYMPKP
jgi:hypothetical protein